MHITPDALEREFSLSTAATRLDFLSRRDSGAATLNTVADDDPDDWSALRDTGTTLDVPESLELLALGEVIARKSAHGRQLSVRSARSAGASWAEIGQALGTTRQSAWEAHQRWIDGQAAQHGEVGQIGFDDD